MDYYTPVLYRTHPFRLGNFLGKLMMHSEILAGGIAALCSVAAGFAVSNIGTDLSFCVVGAIFSGYASASVKTDATKGEGERRTILARRWFVNLGVGIPMGPLFGSWLITKLPESFERSYIFLASGGLAAFCGVSVINFGLPALIKKLRESDPGKLP